MLCSFLLYSTVNQPYVYTFPLFFGFLFHLGHHKELSRVACAYSRFSLVIHFIYSIKSVYMSIPISQVIPSPPFPLGIHMFFSTSVSLFLVCK